MPKLQVTMQIAIMVTYYQMNLVNNSISTSANKTNSTTDAQTKSADKRIKATHKAAIILKSDRTGIIKSGTIQIFIPSSRSDEIYTVTPSQTYESYVF